MKNKVAFNNFKDEPELEHWITTTINNYSPQQMTSLTGYEYILNAIQYAYSTME